MTESCRNVTAVVGLVFVLGACTASDDLAEGIGSVDMAMTAVGSDGATYRLAPGVKLEFERMPEPFSKSISIEGDDDVLSVRLPVGIYEARLRHPSGPSSKFFLLDRQLDDEPTQRVIGELITPMPVALVVESNQDTAVGFAFRVPDYGTVTFSRGNVDVSIDVDEFMPNSYFASLSGFLSVAGSAYSGPYASELMELLPEITELVSLIAELSLTSDWAEYSSSTPGENTACAHVQISYLDAENYIHDYYGFADAIIESTGGPAPGFVSPAVLCVVEGDGYNRLRFRTTRLSNGAHTQSFWFLGAETNLMFSTEIVLDLPTKVYDYEAGIFDIGALVSASGGDLPIVSARTQIGRRNDVTGTLEQWGQTSYVGSNHWTFQFRASHL
jgi:hypothetical protein